MSSWSYGPLLSYLLWLINRGCYTALALLRLLFEKQDIGTSSAILHKSYTFLSLLTLMNLEGCNSF